MANLALESEIWDDMAHCIKNRCDFKEKTCRSWSNDAGDGRRVLNISS